MPGPRPKYAIVLTTAQVAALTRLCGSYMAPFAHVQRARILLLAHQHPDWPNRRIAHAVSCCLDTVKVWRQRWQATGTLDHRPRTGAPREFPAVVRAQIVALACTKPQEQGKVWKRWRVIVSFGGAERVELPGLHRWLGARWSAA